MVKWVKAGSMASPFGPEFMIWIMTEGDKLYMMRCAGERIAALDASGC